VPYSFVLLKKVGSGCDEYFANGYGKFKTRAYRFSKNLEIISKLYELKACHKAI
jgi:hypothetical protein